MKYAITVLILIGCALSASATSTTLTTPELRQYCRSISSYNLNPGSVNADSSFDIGYCIGYMMGFFHLADAQYTYDKGKLSQFTFIDRNMTVGQLGEMFVKYVDAHPEELDDPPAVVLALMLFLDGKAELNPVKTPLPHWQ